MISIRNPLVYHLIWRRVYFMMVDFINFTTMERKIIHIDMDAFYASIEQRDHPQWRGKPLVVGRCEERDVVSAASYEARKYGVFSAMPSLVAKRRCPSLIFAPHRFDVYHQVSAQIRAIFLEYTDLVEPLSLDEAYLDVTVNKKGMDSAVAIAREIKQRIFEETGLTASAGVSVNKFTAKIASDQRKPNGLFVIRPQYVVAFILQLPIDKFYGVGSKTAEKMHALNIHYGRDLADMELYQLKHWFGKAGRFFYDIVRGIDNRPVEPSRESKSVGIENTFEHDLVSRDEMMQELNLLAEGLWQRFKEGGMGARTLTLKVKYNNFEQVTRSRTPGFVVRSPEQLFQILEELLKGFAFSLPVRLLGLSLSNFGDEKKLDAIQLSIDFPDFLGKKKPGVYRVD